MPPATTSGPSVAHKPNTSPESTAPSPGLQSRTFCRVSMLTTRHVATPIRDRPGHRRLTPPPTMLSRMTPARSWLSLLSAQTPAGWKRGFSQADLRRLRTTRSSLRVLVFPRYRREKKPETVPSGCPLSGQPPSGRSTVSLHRSRPPAAFFRNPVLPRAWCGPQYFGLALGLGLGRWWLAEVVGFVALNLGGVSHGWRRFLSWFDRSFFRAHKMRPQLSHFLNPFATKM